MLALIHKLDTSCLGFLRKCKLLLLQLYLTLLVRLSALIPEKFAVDLPYKSMRKIEKEKNEMAEHCFTRK